MVYPTPSTAADLAAEHISTPINPDRIARQNRRPARTRPQLRAYEAAYLSPQNTIEEKSFLAPAFDTFSDAFSAFARGTLIATDNGPIAVEDLLPGDRIATTRYGMRPLMWKGSTQTQLASATSGDSAPLVRFSADSFGLGRPMPDLTLGKSAGVLNTSALAKQSGSAEGVYSPAQDFIDGCQIFDVTPARPITVYHIALDVHAGIVCNGLEVESFHPTDAMKRLPSWEMRDLYKTMFPHVEMMGDFGGRCLPRYSRTDLKRLAA